jgi:hypothetical protein
MRKRELSPLAETSKAAANGAHPGRGIDFVSLRPAVSSDAGWFVVKAKLARPYQGDLRNAGFWKLGY